MSMELINLLQEVRDQYEQPMHINSGLRCPAHNASEGGSKESAHLGGLACDFAVLTSSDRYTLLPLLLPRFRRLGIGPDFIHVDVQSQGKAQEVLWLY